MMQNLEDRSNKNWNDRWLQNLRKRFLGNYPLLARSKSTVKIYFVNLQTVNLSQSLLPQCEKGSFRILSSAGHFHADAGIDRGGHHVHPLQVQGEQAVEMGAVVPSDGPVLGPVPEDSRDPDHLGMNAFGHFGPPFHLPGHGLHGD